jgi:hypothetical protein
VGSLDRANCSSHRTIGSPLALSVTDATNAAFKLAYMSGGKRNMLRI